MHHERRPKSAAAPFFPHTVVVSLVVAPSPSAVACHAVAQIADALFRVLPLDSALVVAFVARVAGIAAGMAGGTVAACIPVI